MNIFFSDPNEIPLPPEEVRIRDFRAEPWSNGRMIRIYLEVDPTQKRPSAELSLIDPSGEEVSNIHIVESMTRKMEVNMHLRSEPKPGEYTLSATLFFSELIAETEPDHPPEVKHQQVDTTSLTFIFDIQA